jgi:hypothetical protein
MTLREIASWRYSICAVCDDSGRCQVEEFLLESRRAYPKAVRDMTSTLRDYAPQHGPPFEVDERAKRLRDDICELKAWQGIRKRKRTVRMGLRIFFFEDQKTIVCTTGFLKPSVTPEGELDEAVRLRAAYFDHKQAGTLHLLTGWGV